LSNFEYSQAVDMNNSHSKIMVVECLDPRFRAAYDEVAEEIAGGKKYDRTGTAGVSKAIVEGSDGGDIIRNIQLGRKLHGIEETHLFEHMQCGGYGAEEDPEDHYVMLMRAGALILSTIPELKVQGYLFHETHAELVEIE
jgi:hypothetical protein